MTENIFPYELPENWQWTTWGQCGKFIAGSGFKEKYQGLKNYKIPFYKVGSLKFSNSEGYIQDKSNTINENILKILKAKLIPENSLLFAKIGEAIKLNRRALNNFPCCIDNNLMAFVSEKILPRYTYYWSQGINLYDYTNATTVPAIRKSDLEQIPIPLPPIDEQKRIVERLESLFSKLDLAKEKVQTVLDGYELRRSAILHKAFTGELSKKFRAENNLSLDDWHEVTMDDIFTLKAGKNISATEISSVQTPVNQYPCFGGNGIRGFVNSYNSEGNFPIIGRQGALCGNINMATGKFYATEHAVVVTFKKKIESKWAENYLRYLNLNQYATATAQPGLAVKKILKVKIKYIPFAEQKEIVRVLDSLLVKEQRTKEIAEKILSDIDLLKKSILARAFRGEL